MFQRLRILFIIVAAAYPLALLAVILMLRFLGERWWVTTVALYLPRLGFAIPLPFTLAATWLWAPRLLFVPQLVAIYLLLFPLMGLNLGIARSSATSAGGSIRLVSYNIDSGRRGVPAIAAQVRELDPDVVLLQESHEGLHAELAASFAGWHVDEHGQFFLASRFPIRSVFEPPPLMYARGQGGAHFMTYVLATPIGDLEVFSVHTTSPREGLEELRGNGLRQEIRTGRLFSNAHRELLEFNAHRRQRQLETAAGNARNSSHPVIIAGDTNLPGLSRALGEALRGFSDAFKAAGRGFGYTFPQKHPWMRIDRIYTDARLKALAFHVGRSGASDHLCVMAEIGKAQ